MTVAILLLACLVLAAAVGVLGLALRELRDRVRVLETSAVPSPTLVTGASAPAPSSTSDYVITRLGSEPEDQPAPTLETKLFADVVLRESVVKAASWAHGVRRAVAPANRNRIWFEMRREVKRARKDRQAEEREAIREYRARRRASEAA
jgi:hypothetical protein